MGAYSVVATAAIDSESGSLKNTCVIMRSITNKTVNKEPKWRHNKDELTTGYDPRWGN